MGFKELNGGKKEDRDNTAIQARNIAVGDSVEGHIVRFVETEGKFGKSVSPVLRQEDGSELVVWASGNLKYLRDDLAKNNVTLGTLVKVTSVEPSKDSNYKTYFKFSVNTDDTLELSGTSEEF